MTISIWNQLSKVVKIKFQSKVAKFEDEMSRDETTVLTLVLTTNGPVEHRVRRSGITVLTVIFVVNFYIESRFADSFPRCQRAADVRHCCFVTDRSHVMS